MAEREFTGTDRFEVRRRLGQGGMGVVYEAFDRQRGVNVALKTLNRFDAQAIYRMKQEFRALADVSHPNVVQLHELVSVDEGWFITMELVDGVDFLTHVRSVAPDEAVTIEAVVVPETRMPDTFVRRDPAVEESFFSSDGRFEFSTRDAPVMPESIATLTMRAPPRKGSPAPPPPAAEAPIERPIERPIEPPKKRNKRQRPIQALSPAGVTRLRETLSQLAEGMRALHDAGKLHRDIKPSNVMVTREGRVVLLDFGLVTEMYEEWLIKSTLEGVVVGTVAYMAPEQSAGQVLTPASDWYSVGVMLFEALTGRLPFEGRLFDILLDKQRLDPPAPKDIVPGVPDDLNRLCTELLRRRPDERPTGRELLRRLGAPDADALTPMSAWQVPTLLPQFVGRDRQLAMLEDGFRAAERGSPVIVHVHGRSGIGKSALVKHFLDELSVSEPVIVLAGRCYERELVPYKALDSVIDALSRYLRKLPEEEAIELMGPDVRALARIFPVLTRVEAIQRAPMTSLHIPDPQELRRRAFAALRNMLGLIAERRTLVLFIDDLQWGDEDSAILLADLMRPPHPPPLLLITCHRTEDRESSPLVRALRAVPGSSFAAVDVRDVQVGPLDHVEATKLAQSFLAERERVREASTPRSGASGVSRALSHADTIARESGGNPLFVYELASYADAEAHVPTPKEGIPMREDTPIAPEIKLNRALKVRFRSLSADAQHLLEIIATAARPIELWLANRAAGLEEDNRVAIATLKAARLVRGRHSAHVELVETYHNRIGDAVLDGRSTDDLKGMHLAIARELEGTEDPDPEALVLHLAAAGELRRAGEYASAAAKRATEALAFDRAASLCQLCVQLVPALHANEWEVRRDLGDALVNAGRGHEAAEAYLTAAKLAPKAQSLELRRRSAQHLLQSGYVDRGVAVMREVLKDVGLTYPESAQSAFRLLNLQRVQLHVRGFEFKEKPQAEMSPDVLATIDVCWAATTGFAMVEVMRSAYFHTRQLRLALRGGEPYRLARALAAEVVLVGSVDKRSDRTARALDALGVLAKKVDQPHAHGLVALASGFTAFLRGEWSDAILHAERAMEIFTERCTGVAWELDTARIVLFSALAYRGELRDLPERVHDELRQAELRKNLYASTILRASANVNKTWLALDRVDDARHQLALAMERWSHADFHLQHLHALLSESDFDLYQGEGLLAWSRISRRWSEVYDSHLLRLRLFRVEAHFTRARCALAAAVQGLDADKLIDIALDDAKKIENTAMGWARSIAALVRAEVAILRGDPARAETLFEEAVRGFESTGMGLHRAVALRRQGELAGGNSGAERMSEADRWMRARGIVKPDRMTAALAPIGKL